MFFLSRQMNLQRAHLLGARPTLEEIRDEFGRLRIVAAVVGITVCILTNVILPSVAWFGGVFDYEAFEIWVNIKWFCLFSLYSPSITGTPCGKLPSFSIKNKSFSANL